MFRVCLERRAGIVPRVAFHAPPLPPPRLLLPCLRCYRPLGSVCTHAEQKQTRKRVGFSGMKAPARDGTEVFDADGKDKIGKV